MFYYSLSHMMLLMQAHTHTRTPTRTHIQTLKTPERLHNIHIKISNTFITLFMHFICHMPGFQYNPQKVLHAHL